MTTLSIQVDEQLMARARELAKSRNMSVEEMLHRLLRVVAQPPLRPSDLPPHTRAALGIAPPMSDEEVERILDEERMRKYGS